MTVVISIGDSLTEGARVLAVGLLDDAVIPIDPSADELRNNDCVLFAVNLLLNENVMFEATAVSGVVENKL